MFKGFKKKLAVVVTMTLLLQSGGQILAEEVQTNSLAEATLAETLTEAVSGGPQTKPETGKAVEVQSENLDTQTVADASQTEAPEETSAEVPQTEMTTEVLQTDAPAETPTEVSQTDASAETPTEAPQTETYADTSAAETETHNSDEPAPVPETSDSEKETDAKTVRSERENEGETFTALQLLDELEQASPYLIVAEEVDAPEALLKGQKIAFDKEGKKIAASLEKLSITLADAKSSSDVEIINLYADKEGKLDTAQLDKKYSDHVIDVTKKYFVINVIADSADQDLNFSGYEMMLSDQRVEYTDESQPGDILYNFAALNKDGKEFTGYKGKVSLMNDSGLQGAFLAPEAEIAVDSELAGALYARKLKVEDSVEKLLHIVFMESSQPGEVDETPANESGEGSKEQEENTEIPEVETDALVTEPETEAEVSTETSENPDSSEILPEEPDQIFEGELPEMIEVPESDDSPVEVMDAAVYTIANSAADYVVVPTADSNAAVPMANVSGNRQLNVRLADNSTQTAIAGTVTVAAAENIVNTNGQIVYAKDAQVVSVPASVDAPAAVGAALQYSGRYYLTAEAQTGSYLGIPRRYFTVSSTGTVAFGNTVGWESAARLLTLNLYTTENVTDAVVISVTDGIDGSGTPVSGAAFVIKSNGKIIRDINNDNHGNPVYYVVSGNNPVILTGLPEGEYVISQIRTAAGYGFATDQTFTVTAGEKTDVYIQNALVDAATAKTVRATAQILCNSVVLSALEDTTLTYYAALFSNEKLTQRVSEPKSLIFKKDANGSLSVSFEGLAVGTYYIGLTDEYGERLDTTSYPAVQITNTAGTTVFPSIGIVAGTQSPVEVGLRLSYVLSSYPEGFYYMASLALTKEVRDSRGKLKTSSETFYADLYSDAEHTQKVTDTPIAFAMNGRSSVTVQHSVKATQGTTDFYIVETDQTGKIITAGTGELKYAITLPGGTGKISANCRPGATTALIRNQLSTAVVRLRVLNPKGQYISGATLALKNSKGTVVSVINQAPTFASRSADIVLEGQFPDGDYYLSEITAAPGYAPSPDVAFTVESGRDITVTLENAPEQNTGYSLAASKQVYSGQYLVYALDNSTGTNAAAGRYTFYAALFEDAARTRKVSNVQTIQVSGLSGSTTFNNLTPGKTYYVAETTQYGEVVSSTSTHAIRYAGDGAVTMNTNSQTTLIQNIYSGLPAGYRYTGTLTITKNVQDASGAAKAVADTFYAGIFRTPDYSDTPTIVNLALNNASSVSVRRRILLSGSNDITYYIAEVDANGNRVDNSDTFGYTVTVDQPSVTISRGDDKTVTVTNQEFSSKVTLYLTKRVYNGTQQVAVTDTFYAGLFKDAQFTQLYTKPIPMTLQNRSDLTLKLSLNLGTAANATIYIAEVDQDGRVIRNESRFGYNIRVANSTAAFTQQTREIQTIFINSVYGTTSEDDWHQIFSDPDNIPGYGYPGGYSGGYIGDGWVSGNGEINPEAAAVQTGDETPVALYIGLLAAAVLILIILLVVRRNRKKN